MDVVVIGGGVAGTVSATALRRLGARVRVYEAYPDPGGAVGSYVSLAANGLRALERVDCLAGVAGAGFPVERQRMWDGHGKLLGDVPRARAGTDPLRSITLTRAALVGELRSAALAAGVEVHTGERLVSVESAAERVVARFAGGREVGADLLVGADGIWSTVRGLLNPALAPPGYAGQYTLSGVSTGVGVEPGVFNLAFCRNGAFLWVATPSGEVWWQAQVTSAEPPPRSWVDQSAWLARLATLYRGEPEPLRVMSACERLHPVIVNHFLGEVPTWHSDRVVLVGDAAHPIGAGQGASMAIEDAVALASALGPTLDGATTGSRVAEALGAYEAARRPRIRKVLKVADDNRRVKKSGPVSRRLRSLVMPLVVPRFYEKATAWLYAEQPPTLPLPATVPTNPTPEVTSP